MMEIDLGTAITCLSEQHCALPCFAGALCMPRLSAAPISLNPVQAEELQRLARAHKTPRKLAERAEMILRSAAGMGVRATARQLGIWPKTVRHWRACWLASAADTPVT